MSWKTPILSPKIEEKKKQTKKCQNLEVLKQVLNYYNEKQ